MNFIQKPNLWFFTSLLLLLLGPTTTLLGLNPDGTLLLSFRYSILSDPLAVLDNWNYADESPCLWTGVTCEQLDTEPAASMDTFRVVAVVLPNSQLLGSVPDGLGSIPHLRTLDLSGNFLNGTLPGSLFNASELRALSLSGNKLSGVLPPQIGNVVSLRVLNLSDNALGGTIPETITSLRNLTVVSLRGNYFSGAVPGGFQSVEVLDVSSNLLNGSLPEDFGGGNLRYLNLSYNSLSGIVSGGFASRIPANVTLDLSFNKLAGTIPESLALSSQKTASFEGNIDLCGKPLKKLCTIPSTMSNPPINASNNTSPPAIAAIPRTIGSTPLPNSSNSTAVVSDDHGLKPITVVGIVLGDLAGLGILVIVFLYVYQQKKKKKSAAAKGETAGKDGGKEEALSKWITSWTCIGNGGETSEATTGSESEDNSQQLNKIGIKSEDERRRRSERRLVMVDGETELELETLLKASAYVLGSSGSSIVYKAVLEDGTAFAVRRLGESGGVVERLKDLEGKVRAIAKLRHPNLVRVRGLYWGDDEKLVICDYVCNGSLASAFYRKMGASPYHLPFESRLKIARGVARGLAFLHDKKHVHGNIKPTNILLAADSEPLIADFGLHRLFPAASAKFRPALRPDDLSSSRQFGSKRSSSSPARDVSHVLSCGSPYATPAAGFVGCTSPYHAPESFKSRKPSPKWDVYSFGIVLLELLTGKVFSERELGQWSNGSWSSSFSAEEEEEGRARLFRMADLAIRDDVDRRRDATLAWFKLGFSCASLQPQKRPSMKDALQLLDKLYCSC